MIFRDARPDDAAAIADIYAHYVLHGTATFETESPSPAAVAARVAAVQASGWPWLVAEDDGPDSPRHSGEGRNLVVFQAQNSEPVTKLGSGLRRNDDLVSWHRLLGYASACQFRDRAAYRHTGETSIYLREDCRRRGIGGKLLAVLIARAEAAGARQLVAVIGDSDNAASIGLHTRHGFAPAGLLREVGYKFGRWIDVVYMQRSIGE